VALDAGAQSQLGEALHAGELSTDEESRGRVRGARKHGPGARVRQSEQAQRSGASMARRCELPGAVAEVRNGGEVGERREVRVRGSALARHPRGRAQRAALPRHDGRGTAPAPRPAARSHRTPRRRLPHAGAAPALAQQAAQLRTSRSLSRSDAAAALAVPAAAAWHRAGTAWRCASASPSAHVRAPPRARAPTCGAPNSAGRCFFLSRPR
jgi:hypothetical protein